MLRDLKLEKFLLATKEENAMLKATDFGLSVSNEEGNMNIYDLCSLRMLAQLVSHSGGTPQVLSSTPRGSEFQPEGKKIPSLAPVPMHWCGRPRSA